MANDGVDYTIVFPDALVSDTLAGNKITSCHTVGMGWMQRQTSCQVQGCVTICYTAALKTVFFSESFGYKELRNTALKLLEILYDYEVENSPICFHVFSNGGFMLYRYIVELLHSHKQFSTLCRVGAVVDSAPGTRNVRWALRALTATL